MTGTKDLFNSICSMDNLYRAYQNAKSGKGWYKEVKQIEKRPFYYLAGLQYMLKNHLFKTSDYEIFILNEGKKKRDVYKLPFFPDRIAQWAILQVIEPFLVANMTADTYIDKEHYVIDLDLLAGVILTGKDFLLYVHNTMPQHNVPECLHLPGPSGRA